MYFSLGQQRPGLLSFSLALVFVYGYATGSANAQTDVDESAAEETTADAKIPEDELQIRLRPLTKDELEVELAGWMDLLRDKIREVGDVELQLKGSEGDAKNELAARLVELKSEESDLAQRARSVADSLQSKGGEVGAAEQFISAVSKITKTTDVTSFWAALVATFTNWAKRDDGGRLWVMRATAAVIILIAFWLFSKVAGRLSGRALARHPRASNLLENFARRTAGGCVFIVGILMALSALGVEIGPMMAALGAGGFIVGFALQETLGSFASGLMIMVYRPFDVDDYVAISGVEGTVKEMSLVSTTLLTIDNTVVVIPNKKAWGDTIINYTGRDLRRVDLVFGIGYDDDIQHAMRVLREVATAHERVLDDPPLTLHVGELADSSVNILCRPWVKTEDYWDVYWDLMQHVKTRFDAEGISIPFPQRDVHMYAHQGESVST